MYYRKRINFRGVLIFGFFVDHKIPRNNFNFTPTRNLKTHARCVEKDGVSPISEACNS